MGGPGGVWGGRMNSQSGCLGCVNDDELMESLLMDH